MSNCQTLSIYVHTCFLLAMVSMMQAWGNNSTGCRSSSKTRQFVNNSCNSFQYRASTWLRYQWFGNRLDDEPWIGTPIPRSLLWCIFCVNLSMLVFLCWFFDVNISLLFICCWFFEAVTKCVLSFFFFNCKT